MKVFITGAAGYIGREVCNVFSQAGHFVYGLIRENKDPNWLLEKKITSVIGDINHLETYRSILDEVDVVIHCASDKSKDGVKIEEAFVNSVLKNLQGSLAKRFIYTSGIWSIGSTFNKIGSESTKWQPLEAVKWRANLMKKIGLSHLTSTIILPGCVYGKAGGLTGLWFESGEKGAVEIVGDGNNHWPMIHVKDLARAYLKAAESSKEGSSEYIVVDDSDFTVFEMAQAVASCLKIPDKIHSLNKEDAYAKFGDYAEGFRLDQQLSNARSKNELGWKPIEKNFIEGIKVYYQEWKQNQK